MRKVRWDRIAIAAVACSIAINALFAALVGPSEAELNACAQADRAVKVTATVK